MPENYFRNNILLSLKNFESSFDEDAYYNSLNSISKITNISKNEILKNEFVKLSKEPIPIRKIHITNQVKSKETIPLSLRKILLTLYQGRCQVTDFTFLMRNDKPYFEIHHIDPFKGNHLKNLLVVCPNVHAQFTYARLKQVFDDKGWLRNVKFNNVSFPVHQIIDGLPDYFEKEVHI